MTNPPTSSPNQKVDTTALSTELTKIRALVERMAINQQIFFNVEEAAEFTRLSTKTINRLKDDNRLIPSNGGVDRLVFHRDDLIRFMRPQTAERPAKPKKV